MSLRIFCLLSPNISNMIIPQKGDKIQKRKTHPIALRPLFLAILAGRKIKSHKKIIKAIITNIIDILVCVIILINIIFYSSSFLIHLLYKVESFYGALNDN